MPFILKKNEGFTLIELITDIAILGILLTFIIVLIDPVKQLAKLHNSQRQQDLAQIKNALDLYYQDYNCYPATIPFNQPWIKNTTVYMKKVPQSPDCSRNRSSCYTYITNSEEICPQWNITFAELAESSTVSSPKCSLPKSCLPSNFSGRGFNFCSYSGNIDCEYLSSVAPPVPETISSTPIIMPTQAAVTPTPTPLPTVSATPTSAPVVTNAPFPSPVCSQYYACRGGPPSRCNILGSVPPGITVYCSSDCNNSCGLR